MQIKETVIIRNMLPEHYTCESRDYGVYCHSLQGIKNEKDFDIFMEKLRLKFGDRFQEVYHQTCTYHISFSVYLREE